MQGWMSEVKLRG